MLLTTPLPKELRVVEPLGAMLKSEAPVEVLTWKAVLAPLPWTKKLTLVEVALMPAMVPLSIKAPVVRVEALLQRAA